MPAAGERASVQPRPGSTWHVGEQPSPGVRLRRRIARRRRPAGRRRRRAWSCRCRRRGCTYVVVVQALSVVARLAVRSRTTSAGQSTLAPVQVSATSQSPASGRQTVVDGRARRRDRSALAPVQFSATSQTPADGRQTVVVGLKASAGQRSGDAGTGLGDVADARGGTADRGARLERVAGTASRTPGAVLGDVAHAGAARQTVVLGANPSAGQVGARAGAQLSATSQTPAAARHIACRSGSARRPGRPRSSRCSSRRGRRPRPTDGRRSSSRRSYRSGKRPEPVQVSAMSQTPAVGRQTCVLGEAVGRTRGARRRCSSRRRRSAGGRTAHLRRGCSASAGHAVLTPSQFSAASQTPTAPRQTVRGRRDRVGRAGGAGAGAALGDVADAGARRDTPSSSGLKRVGRTIAACVPCSVSATSQTPAAARQIVVGRLEGVGGTRSAEPVQLSATSQTPAAARHTVEAGSNASAGQRRPSRCSSRPRRRRPRPDGRPWCSAGTRRPDTPRTSPCRSRRRRRRHRRHGRPSCSARRRRRDTLPTRPCRSRRRRRRRPTRGRPSRRESEASAGTVVAHAVAALGHVADARRAAADRAARGIGGARGARAGAGLGDVARRRQTARQTVVVQLGTRRPGTPRTRPCSSPPRRRRPPTAGTSCVEGEKLSAGQAAPEPVQFSATSQTPADGAALRRRAREAVAGHVRARPGAGLRHVAHAAPRRGRSGRTLRNWQLAVQHDVALPLVPLPRSHCSVPSSWDVATARRVEREVHVRLVDLRAAVAQPVRGAGTEIHVRRLPGPRAGVAGFDQDVDREAADRRPDAPERVHGAANVGAGERRRRRVTHDHARAAERERHRACRRAGRSRGSTSSGVADDGRAVRDHSNRSLPLGSAPPLCHRVAEWGRRVLVDARGRDW